MLPDNLKTILEDIAEPGSEKHQKVMRQWISQAPPRPEKGKYGQDVWATKNMQRAARIKASRKAEVNPDERSMLFKKNPRAEAFNFFEDLETIVNDAYDYSGEMEKKARSSLRRFGLNPGRERRKAKAQHRLIQKVKTYDAKKRASVIPPTE